MEHNHRRSEHEQGDAGGPVHGLAGRFLAWLRVRLNRASLAPPRLALLERISLAPRQSLALIEAEGRRFLVAIAPEGTPALQALDRAPARANARPAARPGDRAADGALASTAPRLRSAGDRARGRVAASRTASTAARGRVAERRPRLSW